MSFLFYFEKKILALHSQAGHLPLEFHSSYTMNSETSAKFMSSLSEFIQYLCSRYVTFDSDVLLKGQLYLSVDAGDNKTQFVINEMLNTREAGGQNRVAHFSHSFHTSRECDTGMIRPLRGRPRKKTYRKEQSVTDIYVDNTKPDLETEFGEIEADFVVSARDNGLSMDSKNAQTEYLLSIENIAKNATGRSLSSQAVDSAHNDIVDSAQFSQDLKDSLPSTIEVEQSTGAGSEAVQVKDEEMSTMSRELRLIFSKNVIKYQAASGYGHNIIHI